MATRPSSFVSTGDAATALAERTAEVDHLVISHAAGLPAQGFSLLAVGGYGRRQLFPYSDIDLLLLFADERLALSNKEAISTFLQQLWDAGLRVSQSVRTPAECLEVHNGNTELNISLLDQRYLAGDRALYGDLARRLPRFLQSSRSSLIRNLAQLARERHAKYADTYYHLEPDVKETPGGLRDYQLVCWLDQLRGAAPDASPELHDAFSHLARIRCFLHLNARRDQNVLTFESQDAVAERFQNGDAGQAMRAYYRHARAVYRAATRALETTEAASSGLFAQFRDRRSRLSNSDFSVLRDRVHFREPHQIGVRPGLVLQFFEFVARHGVRPSLEAEQQIAARLRLIRDEGAQWPALARVLALPSAPLAVRWMHETGVLTAIFPELESIECLVVRDFYHRYTVDEHTLVAMQNLWSVTGPYKEIFSEIENPAILVFAILFHDSGKGAGGQHIERGLEFARRAMDRILMPPSERAKVEFLIRRHMDLSTVMQSRDVFDPQTVRDVAHQVETVERLKALILMTYADVSAVNPEVMTAWRAEQLWQLYLIVHAELTRELETERLDGADDEFLQGFPTRYLRTHSREEVEAHIALGQAASKRNGGVAVDLKRLETAWQLTLVAADRPGLFAAAAGSLSSFGMNILRAEAFANRHGQVLDTFLFEDPNRTLDLNPSEVDRLRSIAEKAIAGKIDVRNLLKNRPKPQPPSRKARIAPRAAFNSQASETATLVEIVAEDRPGLLYDVASAISAAGANIEVVLIDTQAHKAIDVFYVTANGAKLTPETQDRLAAALRAVI